MRKAAWIIVPLVLAVVGLEIGMFAPSRNEETVLAIAMIACGLAIIAVIVRALFRRHR